jgi:hypothetical protein
MQCYAEAVFVARISHFSEAQSQPFSVAVLATRANLRAAGDWVPSSVSPFYRRDFCHFT